MNIKGTKKKNQVVTANIFERQEFLKKVEGIRESLAASIWHELKTMVSSIKTKNSLLSVM